MHLQGFWAASYCSLIKKGPDYLGSRGLFYELRSRLFVRYADNLGIATLAHREDIHASGQAARAGYGQ